MFWFKDFIHKVMGATHTQKKKKLNQTNKKNPQNLNLGMTLHHTFFEINFYSFGKGV